MVKYRRIYDSRVKKFLIGTGISISLAFGIFALLVSLQAITITGYSGDMQCRGDAMEPCYAYINFTANTDIYIYPTNDTTWAFNHTGAREIIMQRSWGKSWRTIDLSKPWSSKVKYALKLSNSTDYEFRFIAYKFSPTDTIKWGFGEALSFFPVDPLWSADNKDRYLKLVDQLVEVDYAWSEYQICNPTDVKYLDNMNLEWKGRNENVKSTILLVNSTKTLNLSKPIRTPTKVCRYVSPYTIPPTNKSGGKIECGIERPITGYNYTYKQVPDWVEWNGEIPKDECFRLRVQSKLQPVLGERNIEHIPEVFGYKYPEYDWWNSSWLSRKNITFTELAGTDLRNYTMSYWFKHDGNVDAECPDIRVLNESNNTIPYATINCNATHVRLSHQINVTSLNSVTYEVYYDSTGSPAKNASWNDTRCNIYEDFEGDLSAWTGDTGDFSANNTLFFNGAQSFERTSAAAQKSIYRIDQNFTDGVIVEWRSIRTANSDLNFGVNAIIRTTAGHGTDGYISYALFTDTELNFYTLPGYDRPWQSALSNPGAGSWERTVMWMNKTTSNVTVYNGAGVQISTGQGTDATWKSGFAGIQSAGQYALVDDYCSRHYVVPEPSISITEEEPLFPPVLSSNVTGNIEYGTHVRFNLTNPISETCITDLYSTNCSSTNDVVLDITGVYSAQYNMTNLTTQYNSSNVTFEQNGTISVVFQNKSINLLDSMINLTNRSSTLPRDIQIDVLNDGFVDIVLQGSLYDKGKMNLVWLNDSLPPVNVTGGSGIVYLKLHPNINLTEMNMSFGVVESNVTETIPFETYNTDDGPALEDVGNCYDGNLATYGGVTATASVNAYVYENYTVSSTAVTLNITTKYSLIKGGAPSTVNATVYAYNTANSKWDVVFTDITEISNNISTNYIKASDYTDANNVLQLKTLLGGNGQGYPTSMYYYESTIETESFVEDLRVDSLNDGTNESYIAVLDTLKTVTLNMSGIQDYIQGYSDPFVYVPIFIYSSNTVSIEIKNISINYTIYNLTLNTSGLDDAVKSNSTLTFGFDFSGGTLGIEDSFFPYESDGIFNIFNYTTSNGFSRESNTTFDIFWSNFSVLFPPYTYWIEFSPNNRTEQNVTPWGQTNTQPIINITALGSTKQMNVSFYVNQTYDSCMNVTASRTNDKNDGWVVNTSRNTTFSFLEYLDSTSVLWFWADYDDCGRNVITENQTTSVGYCVTISGTGNPSNCPDSRDSDWTTDTTPPGFGRAYVFLNHTILEGVKSANVTIKTAALNDNTLAQNKFHCKTSANEWSSLGNISTNTWNDPINTTLPVFDICLQRATLDLRATINGTGEEGTLYRIYESEIDWETEPRWNEWFPVIDSCCIDCNSSGCW